MQWVIETCIYSSLLKWVGLMDGPSHTWSCVKIWIGFTPIVEIRNKRVKLKKHDWKLKNGLMEYVYLTGQESRRWLKTEASHEIRTCEVSHGFPPKKKPPPIWDLSLSLSLCCFAFDDNLAYNFVLLVKTLDLLELKRVNGGRWKLSKKALFHLIQSYS